MKVCNYIPVGLLCALLLWCPAVAAGQTLAVRTNLLHDALLVPTLGMEYALSDRHSISLQGTYMPFSVGERKWKNWSVQPELRIWKQTPFYGPFLGINVIGGGFNINNVRVGGLYGRHRQGYMMGAGLSVGYHRMLSARWNLELALGADVLLCTYDRYLGSELERHCRSGVVLPIGTGVSVVYVID